MREGNHRGPSRERTGVIAVFAPGSNGNVAPIATVGGDNSELNLPIGIAVKPAAP